MAQVVVFQIYLYLYKLAVYFGPLDSYLRPLRESKSMKIALRDTHV